MQEIRFHGRGGQGTVVASIVLAKAFFKAGYYVQTFPVFGVERRGAPVEAYLRLDDTKILVRSNVYTPDHVLIQDPKLLESTDVTRGLKPGGWILLNAAEAPDRPEFSGYRVATVDAARIAIENHLGTRTHPMINTAMIGAFARLMKMPPMEIVAEAILREIPVKQDQNMAAARQAYEAVRF
ncbi:pyruvate ferredoxin oxidoreductase [Desulfonema ishimotonii]|uniref:Pyruvate ferredoxin oxidoreductase n=2 Tax=Desulfonema ishimotonii TaxID=45657 RepID=A0A401FUB3_9BACT|nr:pyruvate ferredoxin oxidoreductase [Desulfonema ishimotonii]